MEFFNVEIEIRHTTHDCPLKNLNGSAQFEQLWKSLDNPPGKQITHVFLLRVMNAVLKSLPSIVKVSVGKFFNSKTIFKKSRRAMACFISTKLGMFSKT